MAKQPALASGLQVRAARGFLCWDQHTLAEEAGVSSASIERIETGHQPSGKTVKNLSVIQSVLETRVSNSPTTMVCSGCASQQKAHETTRISSHSSPPVTRRQRPLLPLINAPKNLHISF